MSEIFFYLYSKKNNFLMASNILGCQNAFADALSRNNPSAMEWVLSQEILISLVQSIGILEIDLSATAENCRVRDFVSRTRIKEAGD